MNQLEQSQQLKTSAQTLLERVGLEKLLSQFGTVKLTGSYAYDLMALPDVDVKVITDNLPQEKLGDLLEKLIGINNVVWLKFTDFTRSGRKEGFPIGYYLGVKYLHESTEWKIDIWFIEKSNQVKEEFTEEFFRSLTQDERKAIIGRKLELIAAGRYQKDVTAADIYRGILHSR